MHAYPATPATPPPLRCQSLAYRWSLYQLLLLHMADAYITILGFSCALDTGMLEVMGEVASPPHCTMSCATRPPCRHQEYCAVCTTGIDRKVTAIRYGRAGLKSRLQCVD